MKLESWQIFDKSSNIKFNENPLSGSGIVSSGRTDMIKLILVINQLNAQILVL